jgi:hypothetical protein
VLLLAAAVRCSPPESTLMLTELESLVQTASGEPYLFTDTHGRVLLSWIFEVDSVASLNYSVLERDSWSVPVQISSGTGWFVNWADYPLIVADGKGNFMAHFLDRSGPGKFSYDVKITTSTDGVTWNTPFVLHDDGKEAEHGFVSLVPYGEHVFVSWLDGRNTVSDTPDEHQSHDHHGEMSMRAAVMTYAGEKINEWELDSRTCDCCQTTAAVTANGPVVIYRDRSADEVRDISIVRYVNNQWTEPKRIYADNWQINGCPVNGPRCEAINNTLGIAWFTLANNQPQVNVIFSRNGGETFGRPVRISEGEAIGRVDLVMLDENTAVVSWIENESLLVTRVYTNGRMEKPLRIARIAEARSSGFPQMTRSADGVIMAWTNAESNTIETVQLK